MNKDFKKHSSGLYVARDGEVILKSGKHTYGYKRKRDGYRAVWYINKWYYVHRLVAETYIPNPENKPYIDHINTNRSDNRVENLRWCSHKENQNNPLTKHKMSESHKGKHHSEATRQKISQAVKKPIIGTNKETGCIVEFDSLTDAYMTLNIQQTNIAACCRGRKKSAGGYVWVYA